MTNKPIISQAEQNLKPAIRAYLGGSFNPVHNGHIQMAMAVYERLTPIAHKQQRDLQVCLLPNARSPFKEHSLEPTQRLAMLKLAIKNTPLQISELELWQTPPVYSIDSVRTLRENYAHDALIFIMGMDSARSLDNWKEGLQLTDYVQLWIFERSDSLDGSSKTKPIASKQLTVQQLNHLILQLPIELQGQVTHSLTGLVSSPSKALQNLPACQPLKKAMIGHIYIDRRRVLAVSSTQIRQHLSELSQKNANNSLTTAPNTVKTLAKWLNPTVYDYIIDHRLYSAAQFR